MPKQSELMVHFLSTTSLDDQKDYKQAMIDFLEACTQMQLILGRLYYLSDNRILHLVVCPDDYQEILQEPHYWNSLL